MIEMAVSLNPGLLKDLNQAGLLGLGDVHVAQKVSHLFGESDQRVQLALALAVRALREGSTCVEFDQLDQFRVAADPEATATVADLPWPDLEPWLAAVASSAMVHTESAAVGDRPLRLIGRRLYLERYWQEESTVAEQLTARRQRSADAPVLPRVVTAAAELLTGDDLDQATAAIVGLFTGVSVIAGGPGTGKTYTVARVLAMMHRTATHRLSVALAAPTGKAAVRMDEALAGALASLPQDLAAQLAGLRASTIHRLLGWTPQSRHRFVHHGGNPLPHDVVVVDEASMVSVALMARLLDALRPTARLILVGDPHQLAPVEAGAVLADIVDAPAPRLPQLSAALNELGLPDSGTVAVLRRNHRSDATVAQFADAVLAADAEAVVEIVGSGVPGVSFTENADDPALRRRVTSAALEMIRAARRGEVTAALAALGRHRVLCGHRHGDYGTDHWARTVEAWVNAELGADVDANPWYPGRPVMITQNSPEVGLFNGDAGVVIREAGQLRVHFDRGDHTQAVSPYLLDAVQTIQAMTVHKSQGSQFAEVSVILPPVESPLLTRELLYTAITRAEHGVHLIGSAASLRQAVLNRARRASGLSSRL
ncbi:MAG TPA: exodeoxyribonuclease V subunit alpha [Propionicimonas sp.]|nr:exodeoxyribonuclease V subunit alpha [Propionicimonas sp.]